MFIILIRKKLTDFGISRALNKVGQNSTEAVGTPNYMSPEVISLQGIIPAADIWSLGCTIIELLCRCHF